MLIEKLFDSARKNGVAKSVLAALEDGCVAGGESSGRTLTHWKAAQGEAGGPRALPPAASRRYNQSCTYPRADPRTLDTHTLSLHKRARHIGKSKQPPAVLGATAATSASLLKIVCTHDNFPYMY